MTATLSEAQVKEIKQSFIPQAGRTRETHKQDPVKMVEACKLFYESQKIKPPEIYVFEEPNSNHLELIKRINKFLLEGYIEDTSIIDGVTRSFRAPKSYKPPTESELALHRQAASMIGNLSVDMMTLKKIEEIVNGSPEKKKEGKAIDAIVENCGLTWHYESVCFLAWYPKGIKLGASGKFDTLDFVV